jgi:cytochrome c peroxidase
VNGKLSAAAKRGQRLFRSREVGCTQCHPGPLFTDLQAYDVGTSAQADRDAIELDTPTLIEVWRTAPYLHDGSAASLRDVLTTRNAGDHHGKTSQLTPDQINDLAAYVLSL